MNCYACGAELVADSYYDGRDEECTYQFDNALWIGLFGGYGMWVDNIPAKWPNNTDERWLRNSDERDGYGLYCDFVKGEDEHGNPTLLDDPDYVPTYDEDRTLPGHPDYEVVICHECAHKLWEAVPWLERLIPAHGSHAHRTGWKEAHPDHYGWDYD